MIKPISDTVSYLATLSSLIMIAGLVIIFEDRPQAYNKPQWVSLDDAYKALYGVSIKDPKVNRRTGQVPGNFHGVTTISDATEALQRLLKSKGKLNFDEYFIYAYEAQGKALISLYYRPPSRGSFEIISKRTGTNLILNPDDPGWNEPYQFDVNRKLIDRVIDWVAVKTKLLKKDKAVATLLVLAAQSIYEGVQNPGYWQIEKKWFDGKVNDVMRRSSERLDRVNIDVR